MERDLNLQLFAEIIADLTPDDLTTVTSSVDTYQSLTNNQIEPSDIENIAQTIIPNHDKGITMGSITIPTTKAEALAMILLKAAEISQTHSKWVKVRNVIVIAFIIKEYPKLG